MPNTRKKLIELLESGGVRDFPFNAVLADHLIANGVTVQEWIPVTERLPDVCDSYLVVVKYKYAWETEYNIDTDVATFLPYDDPDAYIDNRWNTYNDWDEGQQYIHITHWTPLPEPPKDATE